MGIIDKSFRRAPKSYIVQSLLAVLALAIILYFVEVVTHAAIVAALGASTFIIFAMPHSITAQSRRLVGGHVVRSAFRHFLLFQFSYGAFREAISKLGVCYIIYLCLSGGAINFSNGYYEY